MSRLKTRFDALRREGRGALIPYLQAYDPDPATSQRLLEQMPGAGADIIEIGMPFSDPSADGPTIQAAAQRGLKAGATLRRTLDMVRLFREKDSSTPIVLMGYLNPIHRFGVPEFCAAAAEAGVDGLIIVDVPTEEAEFIEEPARCHGLDLIRLVAPNTPSDRLAYVLKNASGFIYYVSITGITGTRTASEAELSRVLPGIRAVSALPIAIGFGIHTPEQVQSATRIGDAAIVASALIKTMESTLLNGQATEETVPSVLDHVRRLARSIQAG